MSEQFKLCFLRNNQIYKIYVFGTEKEYGDRNVREIFDKQPSVFENIFNLIFSDSGTIFGIILGMIYYWIVD